ncbi:hypothetical protein P6439_14310 [Staphylococcus arlettae]|nr:hypothetical protein [Staphylococcus arlettae]
MPLKNYIVKLKELCRKIKIVTYESERNFIDDEILKQPNVTVLSNEIIWDNLVERIPFITNENTVTELEFEVENFEERKNEFFKSYKKVINELF